jgi:hypothetical protein
MLEPAPAQTVEPVIEARTPTLPRRRAVFKVTSYPEGKKGDRFLTMISMDRATWEAAGFTPEDRYVIERVQGRFTIARAPAGKGYKHKRINSHTVVLQTRGLGEERFTKTFVQFCPGQILA